MYIVFSPKIWNTAVREFNNQPTLAQSTILPSTNKLLPEASTTVKQTPVEPIPEQQSEQETSVKNANVGVTQSEMVKRMLLS